MKRLARVFSALVMLALLGLGVAWLYFAPAPALKGGGCDVFSKPLPAPG